MRLTIDEMAIIWTIPANTRHSPNAVSMLSHRLRHWLNIKIALSECLVFSGMCRQEFSPLKPKAHRESVGFVTLSSPPIFTLPRVFFRLKHILKKIQKDDLSKDDLIKNLQYAASVLETVYIDETRYVIGSIVTSLAVCCNCTLIGQLSAARFYNVASPSATPTRRFTLTPPIYFSVHNH